MSMHTSDAVEAVIIAANTASSGTLEIRNPVKTNWTATNKSARNLGHFMIFQLLEILDCD